MRKTIIAAAAMMALAGCTTAERDTVAGGAIGAGIGALATGDAGGAIAGGAIGAGTGYLLGRATRQGWCRYRDNQGRIYEARCR